MANKSSSEVVSSNYKPSKSWLHTLTAKIAVTLTTAITLTAAIRVAPTLNINLWPQHPAAESSQPTIQPQRDFPACESLSPNNDKACGSYSGSRPGKVQC